MEDKKISTWRLAAHLSKQERLAIAVLVIFYTVGIFGILLPIHPEFIRLTPLNLLLSTTILIGFQANWNKRAVPFILICFATGFSAEVFGVQTGLLFGSYHYGEVLGPKIWNTPLLIGINWILVTFSAAAFLKWGIPNQNPTLTAVLSAVAMVGLDMLIEPDAIQYQMWSWEGGKVPFRNYIGWFVVALPLQMLYHHWLKPGQNLVGAVLFVLQLLFFVAI